MPFDPAALNRAAEAAPAFDEPPPPDLYEAELYKAETFVSRAGEDWLRLTWRVLSGRLRDHQWSQIQTLEANKADGSDNEVALGITGRVLTALGIEVAAIRTPMDLRPMLDKVAGGAYEVEVKRNGAYTNTNVKRKMTSVQTDMDAGGYGQPPAAQSAVYQGDGPAASNTQPMQPPVSDVPQPRPDEFRHEEPPPKRGDIDPATGLPLPF